MCHSSQIYRLSHHSSQNVTEYPKNLEGIATISTFATSKRQKLELKKLKEECYEEVEFQTDGPDGRNDDDVD